jgi:hypothetical protein
LKNPQVVQIAISEVRIEPLTAPKPEIPLLVCPTDTRRPAPWLVAWSRSPECAVYPCACRNIGKRAKPAHPCPLVRRRIELPKIVESVPVRIGIEALAPKKPEVSIDVPPVERVHAAPRDVTGSRNSQRAVHTGPVAIYLRCAVQCAAAAHPRPLVCRGVELPKVIENALCDNGSISLSSEEPEVAARIGPGRSLPSGTRNVSGREFA